MLNRWIFEDWRSSPNPEQSKIAILQEVYNKYGHFEVCTHFENGEWSKRRDVLRCNELEEWWRLSKANNRTILPCEIVIDLDPDTNDTRDSMRLKANKVKEYCDKFQLNATVFFSGSRGYHIHIFSTTIMNYNEKQKRNIRTTILKFLDADLTKISEKTTIALEYTPHWKTGIDKDVEVV
ncbi:MAG: hypothetical protein [Siphoviridae sp. ctjeG17]|nr:MAG: hypothetical protein [Siphoviridae sp. ctjeG17]